VGPQKIEKMTDSLYCELRSFGHYTAQIERNPSNADAYFFRGRLVLEEGDKFGCQVRYDRELANFFDNNAASYYAHAGADFDESIRLRPGFMPAYLLRGQCDFRMDRLDRATAIWEQSIKIDPNYSECLLRLAHLYATEPDARYRNGERAISLALQGCEATDSIRVGDLETLAAAYAESSDFQAAVRWQQRAIELHFLKRKSRAELHGRLASLLAELDSNLSERLSDMALPPHFDDAEERFLFKQWQNYKSGRCYTEEDESAIEGDDQ